MVYTKLTIRYIQNLKECKLNAGKNIYHKMKANKGIDNNAAILAKFTCFFMKTCPPIFI